MIDVIHHELLMEHGGTPGVRQGGEALIDSALTPPRHLQDHKPDAGLAALAAAYLFGLTKNHGYLDGTKRVAFATAATFLLVNGLHLVAPEAEAYDAAVGVSEGRYSQERVAAWIRRNTVAR